MTLGTRNSSVRRILVRGEFWMHYNMAYLTAEGNRIGELVRPVAPNGREEKEENRGDREERK